MKPSIALDLQRVAVLEVVRRSHASNPRVFGSVMFGTDKEGSDLDLLVDALPGATLFDLGGLQEELEELLGVSVDLRTPQDLPLKLRRRVLKQARPI
ncbi:nucleotidyltransferase family protein [Pseudomonas nunensis]|uniref:nucleotidyltransferase family protein n=1 Tax=Pseudomonas nunensis TaxID=2961896 RepID=UPI0006B585DF|nr:nucleotidyltransferase domain-containing protein [Pseudomonas nunensis]KOY03891.1 DNA polymerase [Pseudomonas nunensis]